MSEKRRLPVDETSGDPATAPASAAAGVRSPEAAAVRPGAAGSSHRSPPKRRPSSAPSPFPWLEPAKARTGVPADDFTHRGLPKPETFEKDIRYGPGA
ncbi:MULTISPECIES: hypothetical protein [unclassified Streptomyces]|uniref:hypothetical protein n=1 Tax=unclassified Streptomyces TaxID=2593676 RepID=UPI000BF1BCBA|nr:MULTISPECIES: hypothetical protein [unclassified Streptomyces]